MNRMQAESTTAQVPNAGENGHATKPVIATSKDVAEAVDHVHEQFNALREQLRGVIVGQDEVSEQLLIALLCRGHCILQGMPGLAKTMLVSTMASLIDLTFRRVQFTPDLMPGDITGTEILEEDHTTGKRIFRFVEGPLFGNVILADEINRTPPKTQSALLEAMQEHQLTVCGKTYPLPDPFFVLATQNPVETEGTYPLPEAQLDRFLLKIHVHYPDRQQELEIARRQTTDYSFQTKKVLDVDDISPDAGAGPQRRCFGSRLFRGTGSGAEYSPGRSGDVRGTEESDPVGRWSSSDDRPVDGRQGKSAADAPLSRDHSGSYCRGTSCSASSSRPDIQRRSGGN